MIGGFGPDEEIEWSLAFELEALFDMPIVPFARVLSLIEDAHIRLDEAHLDLGRAGDCLLDLLNAIHAVAKCEEDRCCNQCWKEARNALLP